MPHKNDKHPQPQALGAPLPCQVLRVAIFSLLFMAAFMIGAHIARSEEAAPKTQAHKKNGTLMVVVENDKFGGGTDQHYSNGVMMTLVSPDMDKWKEDDRLPNWLLAYGDTAPFVNADHRRRSISLSLGHTIFTPIDVYTENLVEDDRPYAGWLFLSMGLHSKSDTVLDVYETTIGIVGPSALGEEVQNNFHKLIGVRESNGWNNQIHDEPGLMLTWQRNWRMLKEREEHGWGFDLIPHFGATVGNVQTFANAGGEMRIGWNLPDNFGSSLIGPARGVSAPTADQDDRGLGAHFFAGVDGRAVARNIFLDGNTWQDSPCVPKRPLVADLFAGCSLHWDDYSLTYTQAMRTKEFFGQEKAQVFGSLMLSVAF